MATIPGVSDGELIRTSWGDAVADELNDNVVKKTGSTMSGLLIASGGVQLPATTPTATRAVRQDYVVANFVISAGDVMTGLLTINPAGSSNTCLRLLAPTPLLEWWNEAGSARYGYISATTDRMSILNHTAATLLYANDVEHMRITATVVLIGKTATGIATSGSEQRLDGQVWTTVATAAPNLIANHVDDGDATGSTYASFRIDNTVAGSITQGSGTNTVFNAGSGGTHVATSDYRYKDDLGPIDDPVGRLMQLQPRHLQWKPISGAVGEFDGFLAHEVAPVEASAVVGDKDAVLPLDHPDDPGGIDPQGLDEKRLVPLLTAALQEAHTKIADLTARIDVLEKK